MFNKKCKACGIKYITKYEEHQLCKICFLNHQLNKKKVPDTQIEMFNRKCKVCNIDYITNYEKHQLCKICFLNQVNKKIKKKKVHASRIEIVHVKHVIYIFHWKQKSVKLHEIRNQNFIIPFNDLQEDMIKSLELYQNKQITFDLSDTTTNFSTLIKEHIFNMQIPSFKDETMEAISEIDNNYKIIKEFRCVSCVYC